MSTQITTAMVNQYNSNVQMLLQQKGSKLDGTFRKETVNGEKAFFEQIGPVNVSERTTRHQDVQFANTPHDRRMLTMKDYEWADLVDKQDLIRTIINPTAWYAQNAGMSLGRKRDAILISSLTGTAKSGKDGGTSNTLPSAQTIAVDFNEDGSTTDQNLTVGKLRRARRILSEGNNDMDGRHIACTAAQIDSLLRSVEVTSTDYASVKALVMGDVNSFLGFTFHEINDTNEPILAIDGNNVRTVVCWHQDQVIIGMGKEPTTIVERNPNKNNTQVIVNMTMGGVRMQEEGVVTIACDEDL